MTTRVKLIIGAAAAAGTFAGLATIPSTAVAVFAYTVGGVVVLFFGALFAEAKLGSRGAARPQPQPYTRSEPAADTDTSRPVRLIASRPIDESERAITTPLRRFDTAGDDDPGEDDQ